MYRGGNRKRHTDSDSGKQAVLTRTKRKGEFRITALTPSNGTKLRKRIVRYLGAVKKSAPSGFGFSTRLNV